MKSAKELWQYISKNGLKPLPKTSVSDWADNFRMLSAGVSAEPGRWKTSRAPYQKEIMDAFTQPGVNRVVVMSSSQIGKALDINTPIPTPQGWTCIGDLEPGDEVYNEHGNICHVLWKSDIMTEHTCYKITFSDHSEIVADADHKWYVQEDYGVEGVKLTKELVGTYKIGKRNNYAIPVAGPLEGRETELLIDPYTLGVWLGDGNSHSAFITTTEQDLEIVNYIREAGHTVTVESKTPQKPWVKTLHIDPFTYMKDRKVCKRGHVLAEAGLTVRGYCAECARQHAMHNKWKGIKELPVDPIVKEYKSFFHDLCELGVAENKHIPGIYLRASEKQRRLLLMGIMDTDGSCNKNGRCEITLKSEKLIYGVLELIRSLGLKPTISTKLAVCTNSKSRAKSLVYRVSFIAYNDQPVFRLKRKLERQPSRAGRRTSETSRRRITCIEKVLSRPVCCIAVDSPSHLYLAGDAMIPTHNSDIMNNVIGRFAHLDPCAIMMVQPTIEMAQDFSKTRIAPMLRDTKVLSKLFHNVEDKTKQGAKAKDGNNTILSKIFPGGRLIMCGANSPAGLASRPVRVLLADEVDRFPASAGGEGDPVDLASKRMTTFWNRCMGLFSTPTNEGASRIALEYTAGTQEEWQHQCPNCGEYHTIRHIDIMTEYQEVKDTQGRKTVIIDNVAWRCPDCGFNFDEKTMKGQPQKYVPQNPDALKNGIRSFFVNAFTSPWISWAELMREWLEAKGDPSREQVVMNTRFGEPYKQAGAFGDEMVFLRRREKYPAELPEGVLLLTAAVDTQDNRFEYEICGWGMGEECWGIYKGIVLGKPDKQETWDALDEVLDKEYSFGDGQTLKIARTFIDSGGHYTSNVYAYCERNMNKQRFAIKGQGGPGLPLNYRVARAHGSNIPLIMLGVDDGKQQIMNRLAIEQAGPQYFHFPEDKLGENVRGYDQLYFKGIIAERKKVVKKGGQIREIWEPVDSHTRNEPLDLRVYNLAAMQSFKPNWEKLAVSIGRMKEAVYKTEPAKPVNQPKISVRRNRFSRKNQQQAVNTSTKTKKASISRSYM